MRPHRQRGVAAATSGFSLPNTCFQVPLDQQKRLEVRNVCGKSGRRTSAGTQVGMGIGTGMKQVDKRDVLHNISKFQLKRIWEALVLECHGCLVTSKKVCKFQCRHTNESEAGQADCAAVRRVPGQAAHLRKVRLIRVVPASGCGVTRVAFGTCAAGTGMVIKGMCCLPSDFNSLLYYQRHLLVAGERDPAPERALHSRLV